LKLLLFGRVVGLFEAVSDNRAMVSVLNAALVSHGLPSIDPTRVVSSGKSCFFTSNSIWMLDIQMSNS